MVKQDTQSNMVSIPEIVSFIKQKDYKFIKRLDNGSFGVTILIEDETINETFVCKKYQPQFGIDKEKYYKNFLNEIKLLHKLNHNNIVRVFNYYMYENTCTGFILMEYIDGTSINEFIKNNPEMINDIFEQTINGFAYLEEQKILHRDIRPTNILVDNNGFVKIIDFGFGKQAINSDDFDRSFSSLNWWCTLPMDFQTHTYDFKTEIYFIGKLFEMLISDNEIGSFNYNLILSKMCEIDPKARFQSFENVKHEISENEILDVLFSEEEIKIYRDFANELSDIISKIDKDTKYFSDAEIIQKKLSDLYKNVMLEKYLPENNKLIGCFINGMYRYWPERLFNINYFKNFLNFLKSCSNEKKNIVINNLRSRLDGIERIDDDLINEDEIPF